MIILKMPDNTIIAIVGSFIGIAIFLGIGIQILGSVAMDCSTLDGYDENTPEDSTGWAATCVDQANQVANSYSLLLVILIIVAAASILFVIKFL